jgi:hypothetical protein
MTHAPIGKKRIGIDQLNELLAKGKADPVFRNKLLTSPEATLQAEGLKSDQHWVQFFKTIQSTDFEANLQSQIDIIVGEASI